MLMYLDTGLKFGITQVLLHYSQGTGALRGGVYLLLVTDLLMPGKMADSKSASRKLFTIIVRGRQQQEGGGGGSSRRQAAGRQQAGSRQQAAGSWLSSLRSLRSLRNVKIQ